MKIEMFEKADEINIIALRSAAENRSIAEAEKERIRKEAEERENARIANDVLMKLINAINTKAENGETKLFLEWAEDYTNREQQSGRKLRSRQFVHRKTLCRIDSWNGSPFQQYSAS